LILYGVCDSVMHLCPFCNRRTINLLDDDADADDHDDDDDDVDRFIIQANDELCKLNPANILYNYIPFVSVSECLCMGHVA